NGNAGIHGTVSEANSLVGSNGGDFNSGDEVGFGRYYGYLGVTPLSNGNYVVVSPHWNGNRGAATWANGSTGSTGIVSLANSLVGSSLNDEVGYQGATALSNGNYVVDSDLWNGNRGAVTWGNGSTGTIGIVSDANSLVGSNPGSIGDEVGFPNPNSGLGVSPD